MRFVDVMYAFPTLLLIILLMAVFRTNFQDSSRVRWLTRWIELDASIGGLLFVFIGIGVTAWMGMARLVRGQVFISARISLCRSRARDWAPFVDHHHPAHFPEYPRPAHCRGNL